ncbi:hypothetical protein [Halospeciosus flavus]|uniref:hypothetical protein n=1 Tax=Halospeciosus flavus TaxID=3032283 RepID=UPI003605FAEC
MQADGSSIDTDPADPNETATHKVVLELTGNEGGNALSDIYVNYSVDPAYNGSVANVTKEDVLRVGVDVDESGDIDQQAKDLKRVLHPHNGTLVFDFGGDTSLKDNESVIVVFNNTTNPTTGEYNVSVDVNTGSKFDPVNTTLKVGPNVTDYETNETEVTGYEPASDHDEIIDSAPPNPGQTATHHVAIATSSNEVGNSLSDIQVNYHADGSFDGSVQDVGIEDVKKVGFDIDGDGDIDVSTMDDLKSVTTTNVGETVTFDFGGNYGIKDDYGVIVVYSDVQNPTSPGNYTVQADINVQSTKNPRTGSLVLANYTFRNLTLHNYTALNATYNNTTVLNSTWNNTTIVNSTFTNVTQNRTVWTNVTVQNATLNNTTFYNTTWRNVSVVNETWCNQTWQNVTVTNTTWANGTACNVTWTDSTLRNATWNNTTIYNTSLVNVTWQNTSVVNSTLVNTTWNNTTVWNTTLNNTTVVNSTLVNTTWNNTTTTNVTVTNATLTNVTFQNVTLSNVTISNVTWTNVTITNETWENTSVTNATWSNATLANGTWENTSFYEFDLTDTTFENVTFDDSDVRDVTFEDTSLDEIAHDRSRLENFTVDDEDLDDGVVDDEKIKKEKKYIKKTNNGDGNS